MTAPSHDPYRTLGVSPGVSDSQLRAAYRRLVQLHHPDHNAGSAESTRHFEEVQDAYAQIRRLREPAQRAARAPSGATADPDGDSRLADLEREIRDAHLAHEQALRAARDAAAQATGRASDEELGYITTDDSFSKILADARDEVSDRYADARDHPVAGRIADLIDELASKIAGEPPSHAQDRRPGAAD